MVFREESCLSRAGKYAILCQEVLTEPACDRPEPWIKGWWAGAYGMTHDSRTQTAPQCQPARFLLAMAELGAGQPLGLFDPLVLDEQSVALEPGGTLLMYTDSATDLTDAQQEHLGLERLGEIARANRDGSDQFFCERLWAELTAYRGASVQFDDVALVAIQAKE